MAADDNRAGTDSEEESDAGTDRIGNEPIDGNGTYPFAGLTRHDEGAGMGLPENVWRDTESMKYWAQNKTGHDFRSDDGEAGVERDLDPDVLPERGLSTMIPDLPRAAEADVRWVHPRTGETYKTLKHNAVIDPDKAERISIGEPGNLAEAVAMETSHTLEEAEEAFRTMDREDALSELCTPEQRQAVEDEVTGDDALYNIPTDDYTIINPSSFLRPLCDVLRDRDWGSEVFGEVRLDRGGGRATLDIYVDGQTVESPVFEDDRPPVVVGLQVQWDFFGDWAVRCAGQGLDWNCTNHISRLTDREIVKHAGDVEGRQDWYDWFDGILDSLQEKTDQLSRIIQQAAGETLDFEDLPPDIEAEFEDADAAPWTALYAYMGLPEYLAEHAGRRLRSDAEDPYTPNFWEIHSAATNAVTHHARGQRAAGGAWDDYAQTANDMLFNPPGMEDRIVQNYEADRMEQDQEALDAEGGGVANIRTAFEDMKDRRDQYEEWEEELREMGVEV